MNNEDKEPTVIEGWAKTEITFCHMCANELPLDSDGVHEDSMGEKATCDKRKQPGVYLITTCPTGATAEHRITAYVWPEGTSPERLIPESRVKEMLADCEMLARVMAEMQLTERAALTMATRDIRKIAARYSIDLTTP